MTGDRRSSRSARARTTWPPRSATRAPTTYASPSVVGGHSLPGFSTVDDGLVIDLRRLNAVTVDPARRTAVVGGGALLGDVDSAAQAYGLVVPAGCHLAHRCRWAHARRRRRTDDAQVRPHDRQPALGRGRHGRRSSSYGPRRTENPDLFWALRGGGGNFGVVTSFEYRCHPQGDLVVLALVPPLDKARPCCSRGDRTIADPTTPDELLWTSFVRKAPPLPWIPESLVGTPGVMCLVEWSGDLDEGLDRLGEIRRDTAPVACRAGARAVPHPADDGRRGLPARPALLHQGDLRR